MNQNYVVPLNRIRPQSAKPVRIRRRYDNIKTMEDEIKPDDSSPQKSIYQDLSHCNRNDRASNSRSAEKLTFRKSDNNTIASEVANAQKLKEQIISSKNYFKPRPMSVKRREPMPGRTLTDDKGLKIKLER